MQPTYLHARFTTALLLIASASSLHGCSSKASSFSGSAPSGGTSPQRSGSGKAVAISNGGSVGVVSGTSAVALLIDAGVAEAGGAESVDGGGVYEPEGERAPLLCAESALVPANCRSAIDEGQDNACNGLDDDCDGTVDEGCPCLLGSVKPCFRGPPGRRGVGACADGYQNCVGVGEIAGTWGACQQGIAPSKELCDGLDNDCNGCADDIAACVPVAVCPGPQDPRVTEARPFVDYPLQGAKFYSGNAQSWSWSIEGGPCDHLNGVQPSFDLEAPHERDAKFVPRLSGDYTVTLTVVTADGTPFSCTWVIHVRGPGLRVELCYPESTVEDLDLFLKRPGVTTPWYPTPNVNFPDNDQCDWHNCEAVIRGDDTPTGPLPRADFGYANSDLSECVGGPQGAEWASVGYCANPRLDIDNNALFQGSGLPENINIDAPREGERFRIMVQNASGGLAHPIVNVYCGGQRIATYGAPPNSLSGFQGSSSETNVGTMWRVADVTTHVNAEGNVTCDASFLKSPNGGYFVTVDDASY